jgi:hypothetical protein
VEKTLRAYRSHITVQPELHNWYMHGALSTRTSDEFPAMAPTGSANLLQRASHRSASMVA